MKKYQFEAIIGAFVLFFAAIFLFQIMKSSGLKSVSSNSVTISAKFSNVDGIEIGSDVKISGVKIGVVSDKKLDIENYRAVLYFSINDNIKIPTDSSAAVVSSGLLGGKYIDIRPGSEEIYMKSGDKISYTQSSVNLEELIGKFAFGSSSSPQAKK
ncbi:outer membrane lipid asymmetry maintenance protein MlaD [Candidatus Deianiraea vastatrix]|uniref:Phospholipid ABC transporter-binding protein MlaD n=1 Tax=Candidatus Deianiraea vastatrix TaxID=2163644 RepID=A0A5B8XEU0_9RICK|nr:outer membrane lipid asymmetry maintenance protein MlaD [Candidatus Deianiraea vastatrix]QED23486.1 Putative phospholipid ABC transporter-binding protein MlaD [Candidatus Deianiraea vastatrix]